MQEAVGVLPKHLMRILNLQGYSSCDALAEVKDSDVTQIQSDMRLLAPVKKACLGTDEMRNLYGQFATSPESFIFLNGERKAILKIAEVVRKYGIHHFLPGTSGKPCTDFRPSAKSSDLADVLLRKIKTYYGSRWVLLSICNFECWIYLICSQTCGHHRLRMLFCKAGRLDSYREHTRRWIGHRHGHLQNV